MFKALWVRQVEIKNGLVFVKLNVHLRSMGSPDMKTVRVYSGKNSHTKIITCS